MSESQDFPSASSRPPSAGEHPFTSYRESATPASFGNETALLMLFLRQLAELPVRDWIQAAETWEALQGDRWQRIDQAAYAAVESAGLVAGHEELAARIGAIAERAHWLAEQYPHRRTPPRESLASAALAAARALQIRGSLGTQDFSFLYHPFQHSIPLSTLLEQ